MRGRVKRPVSDQPLPSTAKLVFRGKLFDVYQWAQGLFDGTTVVFEKLKRPDTVVIIPITTDGRVVLVQQRQPGKKAYIGVASGRLEEGETPQEAATREVIEETGYKPSKLSLWDSFQPVSKIEYEIFIFIAKNCRKISSPKPEAGEQIKIKLVSIEQFLGLVYRGFVSDELRLKLIEETVSLIPCRRKVLLLKKKFLN